MRADSTQNARAMAYRNAISEIGAGGQYDNIALSLILSEARKRNRRSVGHSEELMRETDTKWRFVLNQVTDAQLKGVSACSLRAELATRYPFLGMLTDNELQDRTDRKTKIIREMNSTLSRTSSPACSDEDCSSSASSSPPTSPIIDDDDDDRESNN